MPQADGTGDGDSEPQPDHLPSAIADESALVRISSRDMHRHPLGSPPGIDVDVLFIPAAHKLATNLIDHRLRFAFLATPKVVTGRDIRGHRLPSGRRLAAKSRRRLDISIERDEAHLPLVGVSARRCP